MSRIAIITLSLLVAGCALLRRPEPVYTMIDAERFRFETRVNSQAVVIDLREVEQFTDEHIAGAINMPDSAALLRYAGTLQHRPPVYLYCDDVTRSITAAEILYRRGFTMLFILDGGLNRWKRIGLPVVTEKRAAKSGFTLLF